MCAWCTKSLAFGVPWLLEQLSSHAVSEFLSVLSNLTDAKTLMQTLSVFVVKAKRN